MSRLVSISKTSSLKYDWKKDADGQLKLFIYIDSTLIHKFLPNWGEQL